MKKEIINNFDEYLIDLSNRNNIKVNLLEVYDEFKNQIDSIMLVKYFFLNMHTIKNSSEDSDVFSCRQNSRLAWRNLKQDEIEKLMEGFKLSKKSFFMKIFSSNRIRLNGYNMYLSEIMNKRRLEGHTTTIINSSKGWTFLSDFEKSKYNSLAILVAEENKCILKGFENLIKKESKLYFTGPIRIFFHDLLEKRKSKFITEEFLTEAYKIWKEMDYEQKFKYFKLASNEHHEYVLKKLEFLIQNKKKNYLPKTAFNFFTDDIAITYDDKEYHTQEFFDFVFDKWIKLDNVVLSLYETKAKEENERFNITNKEDGKTLNKKVTLLNSSRKNSISTIDSDDYTKNKRKKK